MSSQGGNGATRGVAARIGGAASPRAAEENLEEDRPVAREVEVALREKRVRRRLLRGTRRRVASEMSTVACSALNSHACLASGGEVAIASLCDDSYASVLVRPTHTGESGSVRGC